MPRIRSIKPEFWDDEKLSKLSILSRLLYIGLWNFSDDWGVVKGDPVWLKNKVFPYNSMDLQEFINALDELDKVGRIKKFTYNEEYYYYIPNFTKHQKINNPSKIFRNAPVPEKFDDPEPEKIVPISEPETEASKEVVYPDEVNLIYDFFLMTIEKGLHPSKKTEADKWRHIVDLCHRKEGFSYYQITDIIDYFRQDDFWKPQFLTLRKLKTVNREGTMYITYFWEKLKQLKFIDGPGETKAKTEIEYIKIRMKEWADRVN